MDRVWMHASRVSKEYADGVEEFVKFSVKHAENPNRIPCPCLHCCHEERVNQRVLTDHLIMNGIDRSYTRWIWHGEKDDLFITSNQSSDNNYVDNSMEGDRLEDMTDALYENFVDKSEVFANLLSDAKTPLYEKCTKFTRLSAVLMLYNLKAAHGWSNKSFNALLELLKDMLSKDNVLPDRTYKAKKMLRSMSMDYERLHAYRNDCVLYRNEYASLQYCPNPDCGQPRYKREGVPAKVVRYFPIVPRIKRMFSNAVDAKNLRWHSDVRISDGKLRHPADSPQWKMIDNVYPDFGCEARNLRLALATDGMNPYGNLSSNHSTWPVVLMVYNLPPSLCMKRKHMMLSTLISGPKQPGNDIDVYLAPLIDDLKKLWNLGVQVFDANCQETFTLRAMLFCTINYFPAYGNLSGQSTKGYYACPVCGEDTSHCWLKCYKKMVYLRHRRFLDLSHRFCKLKKAFNGETEKSPPPIPLSGEEVFEKVKDFNVRYGKKSVPPKSANKAVDIWKRRSILFDLPYWKDLYVRHCLDVMHIEKNVFDSLVGTLLNFKGKTKDGLKAREDLVEMKIRPELAPQKIGGTTYLPPECYTFSRKERKEFCQFFRDIKVPFGYSSNISSLVSPDGLKLVGLKTHDCHVIMQDLLPIALRPVLPKYVRYAIIKLCFFFKKICAKVIDCDELGSLQNEIVIVLCELEMCFPPSFFDIMVHLTVHLVREVRLCGPVHFRWMYPVERNMKVLKGYVNNENRPEGCIVERYIVEEAVEFCTEFLSGVESIGIPKSVYDENQDENDTNRGEIISISANMRRKAHLHVLYNHDEVQPYIKEHLTLVRSQNPRKTDKWLRDEHNRSFVTWLRNCVLKQMEQLPGTVSETLKWLSQEPSLEVTSFTRCLSTGYTFYTKEKDDKSPMQNSGVTLVAEAMHIASAKDKKPVYAEMSYYGVIEHIWELDYVMFKVCVFGCKWVDSNGGVKVDELGFTLVDLNKISQKENPFILATQAKQVFYVTDPLDKRWSVVVSGKERHMSECHERDNIWENIANAKIPTVDVSANDSVNWKDFYTRDDHNERIWIDKKKTSKRCRKRKRQA